jgi:hypothetical protein
METFLQHKKSIFFIPVQHKSENKKKNDNKNHNKGGGQLI